MSQKPENRRSEHDNGDDVQRRFKYQSQCAAMLALSMFEPHSEIQDLFCELHQDILLKLKNGKFVGVQVKTRQLSSPPLLATDKELVKTICNFMNLNRDFPDAFHGFVILSNHGFRYTTDYSSLPYLIKTSKSEDSNLRKGIVNGYLNRVNHQLAPRVYTIEELTNVLNNVTTETMPSFEEFTIAIAEKISSQLTFAKNCTAEQLTEMADQLVYKLQTAAALNEKRIYNNFSFEKLQDTKTESIISAKRVTRDEIERTLRQTLGSTIPNYELPRIEPTSDLEMDETSILTSKAAFLRFSSTLLKWDTTLDGKTRLESPVLTSIKNNIEAKHSSVQLILGPPGAGKSALMAVLARDYHESGRQILAIKADQLDQNISSIEALNNRINANFDLSNSIKAISRKEPVIVILDQLDALADLICLDSSRLRTLIDFVSSIASFPNIHVVMTAREFEALHDPNLRNIDATSLTLELPAWRDVKIILENKSYDCSSWPPDLQNLLRTPQHLKIFLSFPRLDDGRIFSNCRSLLDHMWKLSVETTNSELENLLERIAEEMSSTEELRVPTIKFSSQRSLIEKLKSLDILLEDVRSGSISFRHQTLFEYTRARAFIKGSVSLEDFIALRQHSLFVRPQLWNALLYLQDCSKSKYQKEVKKILESTELRLHIRLLIIESLGRVTDPCEIEFRILLPFIENANFRKLIFNSLKTNVSWFNYLHQHFLSDFMKRTQGVARDALILLIASAASEPAKVLELIQTCWLTTGEYDFEILHILTAIYPWNQTAQSMSLILLQRNDVDFRFIEQFYSRDTEKTSDWSAELYLAYLIRHTQNAAKLLPLDSSTGVEIHESIREIHLDLKCPQRAALINLVHRRSPYGIQKEIDKNPESFIKLLWPWFLDILAKLAHKRERESISNEYDETGIHSRIDDKHKHCTLNVIDEAVKQFAIKDPAAFVAFCRENCSSRFKIVHRILVRALCKITVLEKNFAFEYIMADSRRLALGESYPEPDESAQLLSALIPELNEKQITEISKVMLEYCHYPLSAIKVKTTAQERKDYREWNRRHRLVLLKKLPLEFLSPELQLLKRNECRAFEPEQRKTQSDILNNDRSEGVIRIESPMCAAQMEKAQATEIAGLFKILSDKYLNRHPTNWKKGGTSQASESLRELATSMPEKAIEILGYLVPSINEYPASRALNGLYCSSLHMEQLDNTIQCLIGRGFNSGYFICAVADIVADRSDKNIKSPAWLVAFLENSLNSFNGGQDYGSDQKDQEKPGSVLWMNGPTEGWPDVCTYKLASALYRTYVSTNFEQAFNLLRSLVDRTDLTDYRHLWRHLTLREIPLLVKVDRFLAAQLIASLIAKTEGPLLCWAGVQLFAFTGHWLEEETTKQWLYSYLNKNSDWSARAFGELLTFHQAFLSRRIWAAHALNQIFEDSMFPKRESVLSGVALTLGHLWSSRNYEHRILLVNLLAQKNANIRRDLASSFANIELGKDKGTKLFLEIIIDDCDFRQSLDSVDLLENIYPVADWYPEQVYQICSLLLSEHGPSLADYSGSQFMMTGPLLDIALVLQKLSEPYKSKGLDLFEQLMLFNVPDTQQLLADLDQRIDQPLVNPKVVYRARRKRGVRT